MVTELNHKTLTLSELTERFLHHRRLAPKTITYYPNPAGQLRLVYPVAEVAPGDKLDYPAAHPGLPGLCGHRELPLAGDEALLAEDGSLSSVEVMDASKLYSPGQLAACSVDEFIDLRQASKLAGIAPLTLRT